MTFTTQPLKKDCWGQCDYPSECRWGREEQIRRAAEERREREVMKLDGLRAWLQTQDQSSGAPPATTFEEILGMPEIIEENSRYDEGDDSDSESEEGEEVDDLDSMFYGMPRLERVPSRCNERWDGFGCDEDADSGVFVVGQDEDAEGDRMMGGCDTGLSSAQVSGGSRS